MQPIDWPLLLYYITDRQQFPSDDALLERVAAAARAGVGWIQLREKDLSSRELGHLVMQARTAVAGTGAKLLVNGRIDIAIACGLDGVHLTSSADELPASEARAIFASAGVSAPLIGVSCHTVAELLQAEAHGADFAVFGAVFGKGSEQAVGLDALREACAALPRRSTMKVLALGGVEVANADACVIAGAAGVAGIRMFQSGDVAETVRQLRATTSAR